MRLVEFYDIAGLVKGANKGEGLGNQFLSHIRECAAIVQVLRCFGGGEIIHVEGSTDPLRDFGIIKMELILKDLDTVEKRLKKAEGEARTGDTQAVHLLAVLQELVTMLQSGEYPSALLREELAIKELSLLTLKPQIFLLNGKEDDVSEELKKAIHDMGSEYVIADLSAAENIDGLIQKAYQVLGLISFFTTGEDETRAWTIVRGAKAPEAAGAIHTDFEKKFIRAEVISCEKLLEAGDWNKGKQKGWLRLEGKDYVAQDGDVMVIRHG